MTLPVVLEETVITVLPGDPAVSVLSFEITHPIVLDGHSEGLPITTVVPPQVLGATDKQKEASVTVNAHITPAPLDLGSPVLRTFVSVSLVKAHRADKQMKKKTNFG